MHLTPLTSLAWAYQLHYYLCFRTHRRRPVFAARDHADFLSDQVRNICERHNYHLLNQQTYSDQFRCLVSLQPTQPVAKVLQTIKTNSSRECGRQFSISAPVWAGGYLARSVGRVRISAVRRYLNQQAKHHGYEARLLPPVYRYQEPKPVPLKAAHAFFELNHHLVFATWHRRGVFTSGIGKALSEYWRQVAARRGFAIDQISVVPDPMHLLVRIVPKMSIEECALLLLNNGQYFIGQKFPQVLIQAGLNQLWQPSAYAGTCGKVTTALIKAWLNELD